MNLNEHDLKWCLRRTPKPLRQLLKEAGPRLCVAGGFVRACISNEPVNDIDLFVRSAEDGELFAEKIKNALYRKRSIATDNAFTIDGKPPIQIVHRWVFDHPRDVVASFDFTIATGCFWYEDGAWQSLCDRDFYADLAAKRLVYREPIRNEDAGGSILRVLKFYQRGYRIPLPSMAAVIARLMSGVKLERITDEQHLAHVLTGLLREVDPDIAAHL